MAMYQIEPLADGEGDIGSVSVRFRDMSTGRMVEKRWPIPYEPNSARIDQTAPSMKLATAAIMLGAKLKGDALGDSVELKTLADLVDSLPSSTQSPRVKELGEMIRQSRELTD